MWISLRFNISLVILIPELNGNVFVSLFDVCISVQIKHITSEIIREKTEENNKKTLGPE